MTLNVLENIVLFVLDIRLWTGRKTLRPEDLAANGIDPDKLPPGSLASLGSKRIIGTDALSPFAAIKREAEKICLAKGVRFLSGYAVPANEAQEVSDKLCLLRQRFEQAKAELLQSYDDEVRRWIAENPPAWAPVIRAALEPVSHVESALGFAYTPVAIEPPESLADSEPLEAQAQGLFGQLCREVRTAARAAFEQSYVGKSSVTRKALRPILAMREKLSGLVFLDPQVGSMITTIDATLDELPSSGPIEGRDLNMLAGLLSRELARMGLASAEEEDLAEETEVAAEADEESLLPYPRGYPATAHPAAPLSWDF